LAYKKLGCGATLEKTPSKEGAAAMGRD